MLKTELYLRNHGLRKTLAAAFRVLSRKVDPDHPNHWSEIDAIRNAVPGMLVAGNVECFEYAIKNLPSSNPILEIGSFAGLSACVMSYLLQKYGKPNRIWCVDPWQWEGMTEEDDILPGMSHVRYMIHIRNMWLLSTNYFCKKPPSRQDSTSDEFFNTHTRCPLSFAYIDGDHRYEQAKRDFLNVDKWLEKGGFILFDDTEQGAPFGCAKLMPEVKATGRYELILRNPNYLWKKIK